MFIIDKQILVILLTILSSEFSVLNGSVHKDNSIKTQFPICLKNHFPQRRYIFLMIIYVPQN